MAKNKVEIDVTVDDKGTTKKVGLGARQASEGLDKTAKSAQTADRNLKGAAQASANGTKNFAKMTQGMGGLVGAYATLAASLFAVSAAFNFLKSAGDLALLQRGQTAYAAATGVAMKSITNDIIEATDAQISFQEASQAAAIGTAAGLTRQQLTDLGTAAKDVSIILGRDVTDSFNRLVRGVTKAEPELLDELGIILRLEDATGEYAAALGKNAKELTTFERSQAVANNVLSQAEQKYSRILQVTGGGANVYSQLGKSFDDVIMSVKEVVDIIAGPFARVLKDTPSLAIASLGLLISGPLKALGVNFGGLSVAAKKSADEAQLYYEQVSLEAKKATLDQKALAAAFKDTAKAALASEAKPQSKVLERASLGTMNKTDRANLSKALKAAESNYNKHGTVVKGIFKGMSIQMVRDISLAFEEMNLAETKKLSKTVVYTTKAKALYAGVSASIKSMGAALATTGTTLLRWAGYLGIVITVFQLLKDVLGFNEKALSGQEELYQKSRDSLRELNKELSTFAEVQKILAEGAKDFTVFGNLGTAIGQRNSEQAKEDFRLYKEFTKLEAIKKKSGEAIADLQKTQTYLPKEGSYVGGDQELLDKSIQATKALEAARKDLTEEETKNQKQAKEFFDTILTALDNIEAESGLSLAAFREFRKVVQEGGTDEEFERARVKAAELTQVITEGSRAASDAANSVTAFVNSFAGINSAETAVSNIQTRLDQIAKIEANNPTYESIGKETIYPPYSEPIEVEYKLTFAGLNPELAAERAELIKNRDIIKEINILQSRQKIEGIRLFTSQQMQLKGQTKEQRAILNAKFAIQNTEKAISDATEKKLLLDTKIKDIQEKDLTPAQLREKEELTELINQLQVKIGLQEESVRLAELEARAAQNRIEAIKRENSIAIRRALDNRGTIGGFSIETPSLLRQEQERKLAAEQAQNQVKTLQDELETETNKKSLEGYDAGKVAQLSGALVVAKINAQDFADQLDRSNRIASEVTATFADSFVRALDGLVQGTMTVKQAFAEMGISILRTLSRIITEMIAVQILQSIIGGIGSVSAGSARAQALQPQLPGLESQALSASSPLTNRYGGITEKVPGYATGGIARGRQAGYPAILHGTEAVVPLPNGKSIPVEMQKGGQQMNNVTVNVSMGGGGNDQQTSQSNGQDGAKLGTVIANAVQKELHYQKRSGGILNPYGVA